MGKQGGLLLYARCVKLRVVSPSIYALLGTVLLMRLTKLFQILSEGNRQLTRIAKLKRTRTKMPKGIIAGVFRYISVKEINFLIQEKNYSGQHTVLANYRPPSELVDRVWPIGYDGPRRDITYLWCF